MALSGNLGIVLAIEFGVGVANMVFLIPSQTLFQERTPPHSSVASSASGSRSCSVRWPLDGVGGVLAELVGVCRSSPASGIVTDGRGLGRVARADAMRDRRDA